MLLGNHLDFNNFEAQNILAEKVEELGTERLNGSFVYLVTGEKKGFYFLVESNWIYLGELNILLNQGLQKDLVEGKEYLSVKIDGQTLTINPDGEIQVSVKGIGLNQLDRANIRVTDFSDPNKNLSLSNYRIINLSSPVNPADAATKEYVDEQISQIPATGGNQIIEIIDNKVIILSLKSSLLSGIGSERQQIADYINSTLPVNYTKEYSKLNVILEIES